MFIILIIYVLNIYNIWGVCQYIISIYIHRISTSIYFIIVAQYFTIHYNIIAHHF